MMILFVDRLKRGEERILGTRELRNWRRRGFYSERSLVKMLEKDGFNAVRIPVSAPGLNPLPDVMARRGDHVYAFEVKNVTFYAYVDKVQIDKLFRFLNELIPVPEEFKHAIVACHMGKKWIFKQIPWKAWLKDKLPEKIRVLKRDKGNFKIKETILP